MAVDGKPMGAPGDLLGPLGRSGLGSTMSTPWSMNIPEWPIQGVFPDECRHRLNTHPSARAEI